MFGSVDRGCSCAKSARHVLEGFVLHHRFFHFLLFPLCLSPMASKGTKVKKDYHLFYGMVVVQVKWQKLSFQLRQKYLGILNQMQLVVRRKFMIILSSKKRRSRIRYTCTIAVFFFSGNQDVFTHDTYQRNITDAEGFRKEFGFQATPCAMATDVPSTVMAMKQFVLHTIGRFALHTPRSNWS